MSRRSFSLRSAMKEQRSAGVAGGRGSRRSTSRDRTVSVEILEVAGAHVPQSRARLSLANRKSPLSAQHRAGHKHVIDQGCQVAYCLIHKVESVLDYGITLNSLDLGRKGIDLASNGLPKPRRGVASQKNTLHSQHPGVYKCHLYPRLRKKPRPPLI